MRLGDNFRGRDDIYCLFQEAGVLIDKLCGVALDKMEGKMTLKEQIESFDDDEINRIISKYHK